MDDKLWSYAPLQLFDFILLGEPNVTLNKVSNAIARVGLFVALYMYMNNNSSWWIWGLGILAASLIFHYTSVYQSCNNVVSVNGGPQYDHTIIETFEPTPQSSMVSSPVIDDVTKEEIRMPYVDDVGSLLTVDMQNSIQGESLHDARRKIWESRLTNEINRRGDEIDGTRRRLENDLVPDQSMNYFDTSSAPSDYRMYGGNMTLV